MHDHPAAVPGETVDWSYVVHDGCTECGYVPHFAKETADRIGLVSERWQRVLERAGARDRPAPTVWSPVEYACHVRDMLHLLAQRVELMLGGNNPLFENWDQDQVAVERRYFWADPAAVAAELVTRADDAMLALARVDDQQWERTGRRSDGVGFTVASLARFVLHDVEHHLHDVTG